MQVNLLFSRQQEEFFFSQQIEEPTTSSNNYHEASVGGQQSCNHHNIHQHQHIFENSPNQNQHLSSHHHHSQHDINDPNSSKHSGSTMVCHQKQINMKKRKRESYSSNESTSSICNTCDCHSPTCNNNGHGPTQVDKWETVSQTTAFPNIDCSINSFTTISANVADNTISTTKAETKIIMSPSSSIPSSNMDVINTTLNSIKTSNDLEKDDEMLLVRKVGKMKYKNGDDGDLEKLEPSKKMQKFCTICLQKKRSILNLPDNLLAYIFQYLPLSTILGNIQILSKRCQQVIFQQLFMWKNIGFDMRDAEKLVARSSNYLGHINKLKKGIKNQTKVFEDFALLVNNAFSTDMKIYGSKTMKSRISNQQLNTYIDLVGKHWTKVHLTNLKPTVRYCFHHIAETCGKRLTDLTIESPVLSLSSIYQILCSCKILENVKFCRKRPPASSSNQNFVRYHNRNSQNALNQACHCNISLPHLRSLCWEDYNILDVEKQECTTLFEWFPKVAPNLKRIDFRIDKRVITNAVLKSIGKYCKKLEEFTYFEFTRKRLYESIDDGIIYLIKNCPNLLSIDFECVMSITFAIIPEILIHTRNLKKLRIWWCENLHHNAENILRNVDFTKIPPMMDLEEFKFCILEVNHYLWELLLSKFLTNNLKICNLTGFDITFAKIHASSFGKNLQEIEIHPVQNLNDDFITQLFAHSPNLTSFKIGYRDIDELNVFISDVTLHAITSHGKKLKQLYLSGCGFSSDFVSIMCKQEGNLPHLEQLSIINCYSEDVLSSSFEVAHPIWSLKELTTDLSFTDLQMLRICQAFPSLEYMCLNSTGISGRYFMHISMNLKKLQMLDIVFSSNMNNDLQIYEMRSMKKCIIRGYDLDLNSFFLLMAAFPELVSFDCTRLPFSFRDDNLPRYLQELQQLKHTAKLQTLILQKTISPQLISHHDAFRALITAIVSQNLSTNLLGKTESERNNIIDMFSRVNFAIDPHATNTHNST